MSIKQKYTFYKTKLAPLSDYPAMSTKFEEKNLVLKLATIYKFYCCEDSKLSMYQNDT